MTNLLLRLLKNTEVQLKFHLQTLNISARHIFLRMSIPVANDYFFPQIPALVAFLDWPLCQSYLETKTLIYEQMEKNRMVTHDASDHSGWYASL